MQLRLSFFVFALATLAACGGGKAGRLMVDTPLLPYVAPDADELAGIEPVPEPEDKPDAPEPAPPAPKK